MYQNRGKAISRLRVGLSISFPFETLNSTARIHHHHLANLSQNSIWITAGRLKNPHGTGKSYNYMLCAQIVCLDDVHEIKNRIEQSFLHYFKALMSWFLSLQDVKILGKSHEHFDWRTSTDLLCKALKVEIKLGE